MDTETKAMCAECGEEIPEGDLCWGCANESTDRECEWCGKTLLPGERRWCSRDCARAGGSDHA